MIKGFRRKLSSIVLASIVAAGFFFLAGDLYDGAVVEDGGAVAGVLEGEEVTSSIPLDNDGLFEDYVEIQLETSSAPKVSSARGSRLTGTNRTVYLKLKDEISKVADGTLASTVFEVPVNDLGLENKTWTAKELGISAIVVNGKISPEAVNAVSQKLDFDLNTVVSVLLADCPYELYWYDKVSGVSTNGPGISASYKGTEWTIGFEGSIEFYFSVAQDYTAGEYLVDTTNAERVQNAVANAQSIISEYSSDADYEKLVGYRTEICDRVAYNQSAAVDASIPYGDPWQIISVFDGDIGTNVVCEGYSKSFQYLCDRTAFDGAITCITVTGTMNGGTGAGGHMWNVIKMDDGNNYLVDVTNCDTGTIGADDQLFLVGSDSGNVTKGYTFICEGGSIFYRYDQSLWNIYDEAELQIIPKLVVKTGWKLEDGYWYFYDSDGNMVTSAWKKDSKGWCYLGEDGRMVANGWARDSKGWVWMNSSGYWDTSTRWIKYDGDWYHVTKGYRDQSKWMKDSKGWCWLQSDGRMLTNGWAKDSKGWCWIGSAGYMIEKTQWIRYDGGWYHITKGYRDQSKWMKDSKGWCWLQADGRMLTDGWAKDSKGWCWIGSDGYMIEETMLIEYQGEIFGIRNGYEVINGSIEVDGEVYSFGADGKLVL